MRHPLQTLTYLRALEVVMKGQAVNQPDKEPIRIDSYMSALELVVEQLCMQAPIDAPQAREGDTLEEDAQK